MIKNYKFIDKEIKNFYYNFPDKLRRQLLFLRDLIFNTAEKIPEIDIIVESLKWSEPSYIPNKNKIGSPIRINAKKDQQSFALYFNCQSKLISTFRQIYPHTFLYEGNRAIIFNINETIPIEELKHCISLALTYHIRKNSLPPLKKI